MRSVLDEIREQPEHIRHIFMWVCVVITFSVVGFVYFRSTSKQFVAMLHPEKAQERALAEKNQPKQPSPFATLFSAWQGLRANISDLLAGPESTLDLKDRQAVPKKEVPAQELPVSN